MSNLPFWLGIGAAQKGAGSKGLKPSRHPLIAFVVGILIALAILPECFSCWSANNEAALKIWSAPGTALAGPYLVAVTS